MMGSGRLTTSTRKRVDFPQMMILQQDNTHAGQHTRTHKYMSTDAFTQRGTCTNRIKNAYIYDKNTHNDKNTCVHTHIYTHTHTLTYTHTHKHTHTHTHSPSHTYTHIHTLTYTHIHTHTHMYTHTHKHTHTHTHTQNGGELCVNIYVNLII